MGLVIGNGTVIPHVIKRVRINREAEAIISGMLRHSLVFAARTVVEDELVSNGRSVMFRANRKLGCSCWKVGVPTPSPRTNSLPGVKGTYSCLRAKIGHLFGNSFLQPGKSIVFELFECSVALYKCNEMSFLQIGLILDLPRETVRFTYKRIVVCRNEIQSTRVQKTLKSKDLIIARTAPKTVKILRICYRPRMLLIVRFVVRRI